MKTKIVNKLHRGFLSLPAHAFILLVILSACNLSDPIKGIHGQLGRMKTLKPVDSLVLTLDYESMPDLMVVEIMTSHNESYLYTLLYKKNLLKKYSLADGRLVSTIDLTLDERYKFNEIIGFQHISEDTLLCFDKIDILSIIPYNNMKEGV
ncbi:MAG TPA: hypothetical protein PKC30_01325 [Saprospiraceae bacterium]|nr:hypothetical protein [Saprospiraceae bacterium]